MRLPLWFSSLFEIGGADVSVTSAAPHPAVPPIKDHKPYLVAALIRGIYCHTDEGTEAARKILFGFSEDTLQRILDRTLAAGSVAPGEFLAKYTETDFRNATVVSDSSGIDSGIILHVISFLNATHDFGVTDLTQADPELIAKVKAAMLVCLETNLLDATPPHLTHFVMSNHDRVQDILTYLGEGDRSALLNIHHLDYTHLHDYLANPVAALRVGTL